MVRAKFQVSRITRAMGSKPVTGEDGKTTHVPAELQVLELVPVPGGGDPNPTSPTFWQASPHGMIQLGGVDQAAIAQFDLAKEFYVDFTEVE